VGHSIAGAELSLAAASRPDGIAGLVYLEAGYPYAFDNGRGAAMKEFEEIANLPRPSPGASDRVSFSALQDWSARTFGFRTPEAELRQTWDATDDGRPSQPRNFPGLPALLTMVTTPKKHTHIPAPALDDLTKKQAQALEDGAPGARVVRLGGLHHIFLSNEAEVLHEMRSFLAGLR
jgi:non-heme chloroperoxidase